MRSKVSAYRAARSWVVVLVEVRSDSRSAAPLASTATPTAVTAAASWAQCRGADVADPAGGHVDPGAAQTHQDAPVQGGHRRGQGGQPGQRQQPPGPSSGPHRQGCQDQGDQHERVAPAVGVRERCRRAHERLGGSPGVLHLGEPGAQQLGDVGVARDRARQCRQGGGGDPAVGEQHAEPAPDRQPGDHERQRPHHPAPVGQLGGVVGVEAQQDGAEHVAPALHEADQPAAAVDHEDRQQAPGQERAPPEPGRR